MKARRRKKGITLAVVLATAATAIATPPLVFGKAPADTVLGHMTLEEITVTDSALSETSSVVGAKSIIKGKNTTIPDAIKDEPDITISRRAGIGDTKDIVSIRGFIVNNRKSTDPDNPGFYQKMNADYPVSFGENLAPPFGRAFTSAPDSSSDKTKYYLDFGYDQPIGKALVEFKLYKNIEDRDEKNYSLAGLVPGYSPGTLVLDQTVESDRSYGSSLKATVPLDVHEIIGGIQYKVLSYGDITVNYIDPVYNGRPDPSSKPSQEADMIGYFLQDTWQKWNF